MESQAMHVALIADIHGNAIALDAVLAELAREGVDQIVCLGDTAAGCPQPRATLERLQSLGCPVVMGNADAWLLDPRPRPDPDDDWRRIEAINYWCLEQLTPANLDFVRTFQPVVEVELGDGIGLLGFHGSPRSYDEIIVAATPDAELAPMIADQSAIVLAGGHTHTQLLRRYRDKLVVNPGSVGLPYEYIGDAGEARNPPWAEYAVITCAASRLGVDFRRTPVDVGEVKRAALASGMPHAQWWAKDWG